MGFVVLINMPYWQPHDMEQIRIIKCAISSLMFAKLPLIDLSRPQVSGNLTQRRIVCVPGGGLNSLLSQNSVVTVKRNKLEETIFCISPQITETGPRQVKELYKVSYCTELLTWALQNFTTWNDLRAAVCCTELRNLSSTRLASLPRISVVLGSVSEAVDPFYCLC
jgi:hypothetical protein